ncbi:MAG TPA: hypothetical protein VIJ54_03145 [Actinomycetes bacterium]
MSRRVTLPGADELFRSTGTGPPAGSDTGTAEGVRPLAVAPEPVAATDDDATESSGRRAAAVRQTRPRPQRGDDRRPSGRERHDEKITVYLSPDELIDLERARLALRQDHGMAVDRGRIVREALALVLAELEVKGDASSLVRRLRDA